MLRVTSGHDDYLLLLLLMCFLATRCYSRPMSPLHYPPQEISALLQVVFPFTVPLVTQKSAPRTLFHYDQPAAMNGTSALMVVYLVFGRHAQATIFFDDFQTHWWITMQFYYLEGPPVPIANFLDLGRRRRSFKNITRSVNHLDLLLAKTFAGRSATRGLLYYDSCVVDIYMYFAVPFVVPLFRKEEVEIRKKFDHRLKRELVNRFPSSAIHKDVVRTPETHLKRVQEVSNSVNPKSIIFQKDSVVRKTQETMPQSLETELVQSLSNARFANPKIQQMVFRNSSYYKKNKTVPFRRNRNSESKSATGPQCSRIPETTCSNRSRTKRTIFYDDHVVSYYLTTNFYLKEVFNELFYSYFDMFFPSGYNRGGRAFDLVYDDLKFEFAITVDIPYIVPIIRRSHYDEDY